MNIIKKFIQEWREDNANHKSMLRTGKNIEALYDFMKIHQSLITPFQEMNPFFISLDKVEYKNDDKEFILKIKKNEELFQINFHFKFHDGDDCGCFYSQSELKIFALNNNDKIAISSNLVPKFFNELGLDSLLAKSMKNFHELKESQDLEILKKIKVRP